MGGRDRFLSIEPKRLVRSFSIDIHECDEWNEPLPPYHYLATGGSSNHYLQTRPKFHCDCPDFAWQRQSQKTDQEKTLACKHLIAALFYEDSDHAQKRAKELGLI